MVDRWRIPGRLAALAALALVAAPAPGQEGWWNYDWPYRRAVAVSDVPQTKLPGDEIATVTMPTGGLTLGDGRDVRVTTATGDPVNHRVLMTGPGDVIRVAFALKAAVAKYHVYFGNEKAIKPPGEPLAIKRGLLLEMWTFGGGGIATPRQVQTVFDHVSELIGRDFRSQVFLGYNPFGPQERVASLYTGHLLCPDDGEYTFATSSQDASALLIDDKLVVDNCGFHPPQRQARRTGKATLTKGVHELKVYHVCAAGDPVIMAAWQEPKGRRLWTIPPEAFAPIRVGTPGILERYGKSVQADFIPAHAGESFMVNRYFERFSFELLAAGAGAVRPTVKWDFGDGQTSAALKVDHVYLRFGPYKVTMTARIGGETVTRVNTIYVARPWEQVTDSRLDSIADYARIVSGYDFPAADQRDIAQAIALFQRAGLSQPILLAGDVLVKRDAAPPQVLRECMPVYAEALLAAKDPARAVAALAKASEMSKDPAVCASMAVAAGRVALKANDPDKAMSLFDGAIKKYSAQTTDESIRDARIGVGDVWLGRGEYDKALEAYHAARPAGQTDFEKQSVKKGDYARHAEDYLRQKLYGDAAEALDKWESEFPADKLEGFSTLIRARLAVAQRDHAAAALLAEQLVRVNPRSNYAPELLLLAADAYRAGGKSDLAYQALDRVIRDYPESPLAAEAKKKLPYTTSAPASTSRSLRPKP